MRPVEKEPTRDQLLAMAYADGELSTESRRAFEARLSTEPELATEISEYRALQVITRQFAPPEPMDYEWQRIAEDPVEKAGHGLGWMLLVGGSVGLAGAGLLAIARSEMEVWAKGSIVATLAGFFVLLLMTTQDRLRTLDLDPYRKVKR